MLIWLLSFSGMCVDRVTKTQKPSTEDKDYRDEIRLANTVLYSPTAVLRCDRFAELFTNFRSKIRMQYTNVFTNPLANITEINCSTSQQKVLLTKDSADWMNYISAPTRLQIAREGRNEVKIVLVGFGWIFYWCTYIAFVWCLSWLLNCTINCKPFSTILTLKGFILHSTANALIEVVAFCLSAIGVADCGPCRGVMNHAWSPNSILKRYTYGHCPYSTHLK